MADRLDAELWFLELSELIEACESARQSDQASILRRAYALVAAAPENWSGLFESVGAGRAPEDLIASSAYTEAAIGLFGDQMGYMLSRRGDGPALASAWIAQNEEGMHVSGETEALALVTAFASAIFLAHGEQVVLGKPKVANNAR